jgi:hypothetical protein
MLLLNNSRLAVPLKGRLLGMTKPVFHHLTDATKGGLTAVMIIIVTFLAARPAFADSILFDTFGPSDSFDPNFRYGIGNLGFQAFQFVTSQTASLTSTTVALGRITADPTVTRFQLYEGTATTLGLLLETFDVPNTVPPGLSAGAVVTFLSVLHPTLNAGQIYWLSATEADAANWSVVVF